MIIFLIVGVIAITVGVLSIFNSRFDLFLHRLFPDSELDKRTLSPENRYFIRRYLSGLQGIIGGIGCVLLYVLSERQVFETIASWFHMTLTR
jgi:hypothetical protein